ncbi:unnamed protein product [Ceratitis capitata]|uniref:(Mediterranean fruit fly) hypothetical protein n=1 Tax=Ceratitis capitata TaxID=7213 RepID=A0A811UHD9_CERCA|nr:unnamed protein product [Ceratitis capitata]
MKRQTRARTYMHTSNAWLMRPAPAGNGSSFFFFFVLYPNRNGNVCKVAGSRQQAAGSRQVVTSAKRMWHRGVVASTSALAHPCSVCFDRCD